MSGVSIASLASSSSSSSSKQQRPHVGIPLQCTTPVCHGNSPGFKPPFTYHEVADHTELSIDQTGFRECLVYTVSSDELEPCASLFGDIKTTTSEGMMLYKSQPSVLQAISDANKFDNAHIQCFIEVLVHSLHGMRPFDLPINGDDFVAIEKLNDTVLLSENIRGYRLWFFIPRTSYSSEIIFRRGLIRAQARRGLIPLEMMEAKLRLAVSNPGVDLRRRLDEIGKQLIDENVLVATVPSKKTNGRGGERNAKKRARKGVESLIDDMAGDDGDGEEGGDDADKALKQREQSQDIWKRISGQIRAPISIADINKSLEMDNPRQSVVKNVNLIAYQASFVQVVVEREQSLSGFSSQIGRATLYQTKDAVFGALSDGVSLSHHNAALSPNMLFSLQMSNRILTHNRESFYAVPCDEQRTVDLYFSNGEVSFPFPMLTYQLDASALDPQVFFISKTPWGGSKFPGMLRGLRTELSLQERKRMEEDLLRPRVHSLAASARSVASIKTAVSQHITSLALGTTSGSRPDFSRQISPELLGPMTDGVHLFDDSVSMEDRFDPNFVANRVLVEEQEAIQFRRDTFEPHVRSLLASPNSSAMTLVQADVIRVYQAFQEKYMNACAIISKLDVPGKYKQHVSLWHTYRLQKVHRAYSSDVLFLLLDALCTGDLVSDAHQAMYNLLAKGGALPLHDRKWSILPQLSVISNMFVDSIEEINAMLNLQGGSINMDFITHTIGLHAMRPESEARMTVGVLGAPATAKSFIMMCAKAALLRGEGEMNQVETARADHVGIMKTNLTKIYDELADAYRNHTRRFQMANSALITTIKEDRTNPYRSHRRTQKNEDGSYTVDSRSTHNHEALVGAMNDIKVDPDAELALFDRLDVFALLPTSRNGITISDRITDPNTEARRRLFQTFCDRNQIDLAVKSFLLLLSAAGVIRSVNIDLLRIAHKITALTMSKYIPDMGNVRSMQKAVEVGTMQIFRSAYYTIAQSEASPLVHFASDNCDRYTFDPIFLNRLGPLFAPYLYAQMEHAHFMITHRLTSQYSFDYYMMARILASQHMFFRRGMLVASLKARGYPLPDVELDDLLKTRTSDGNQVPQFIAHLLRIESELDHSSWIMHGKGEGILKCTVPHFREFTQTMEDTVQTVVDPNWMVYNGTLANFIRSAMHSINAHWVVEHKQVESIISVMNTIRFNVPEFALIRKRRQDVTINDIVPKKSGDELVMTQATLFKIESFSGGGGFNKKAVGGGGSARVLMNTAIMLLPPHYLLAIALISLENEYTRPRQIVLPLEVHGSSGIMYSWNICRRPGCILRIANNTAQHHGIAEARAASRSRPDFEPGSFHNAIEYREDPEKAVFRKHMMEGFCLPDYHEFSEKLASIDSDTFGHLVIPHDQDPSPEDLKTVYDCWLDSHPAAPGVADQTRLQRFEAGNLGGIYSRVNEHYPSYFLNEIAVQRSITKFASSSVTMTPRRSWINSQKPDNTPIALKTVRISDVYSYATDPRQKKSERATFDAREIRFFVRGLRIKLCMDADRNGWWSEVRARYQSPQWNNLLHRLVSEVVYTDGTPIPAALPAECPVEFNASAQSFIQSNSTLRVLTFSEYWLEFLAFYYLLTDTADKMTLLMTADDELTMQEAFDRLLTDLGKQHMNEMKQKVTVLREKIAASDVCVVDSEDSMQMIVDFNSTDVTLFIAFERTRARIRTFLLYALGDKLAETKRQAACERDAAELNRLARDFIPSRH